MATSPAYQLAGLNLDGGWYVKKRLDGAPGATGSMFSCGYEIADQNGRTAFLKALDYTSASTHPISPALNALTAAFIFERTFFVVGHENWTVSYARQATVASKSTNPSLALLII